MPRLRPGGRTVNGLGLPPSLPLWRKNRKDFGSRSVDGIVVGLCGGTDFRAGSRTLNTSLGSHPGSRAGNEMRECSCPRQGRADRADTPFRWWHLCRPQTPTRVEPHAPVPLGRPAGLSAFPASTPQPRGALCRESPREWGHPQGGSDPLLRRCSPAGGFALLMTVSATGSTTRFVNSVPTMAAATPHQ